MKSLWNVTKESKWNVLLKYLEKRTMSVQVQASLKQENSTRVLQDLQTEWEFAKSYDEIPTLSRFLLLRSFLPGGKYYNKPQSEILKSVKSEYGLIVKFPGMFGRPDMLMSFDPVDHEKVLRTEGQFPVRPNLHSLTYYRTTENPELYKKSIGLGLDSGESWSRARSAVNPVLMQPRTVFQYIEPLDSVAKDLIERMISIRDKNTLELPANFDSDLHRFALESMGIMALDTRLGLINNTNENTDGKILIDKMQKFFKLMYELDMKPSLSRYISTPKFKEMMKLQYDLQGIVLGYIDKTLERNKQKGINKNIQEGSVLERLIAIDREIALMMVSDMLMFGVDTTSSALISCLYLISKNPKKQKLLFNELKKILPEKNSPLARENMLNLPYLRACIKEALRIYPVALANSRVTSQDLVLSGYRVPKGTSVNMLFQIIQVEEKHYPKPLEFIPERWLRDQTANTECPSAKTAHPFIYLPFGFGPRMCVGKRLAQLEIEVALIRILRNFHVEFNHPDLVFESHTINVPKGDFKFKLTDVKE